MEFQSSPFEFLFEQHSWEVTENFAIWGRDRNLHPSAGLSGLRREGSYYNCNRLTGVWNKQTYVSFVKRVLMCG